MITHGTHDPVIPRLSKGKKTPSQILDPPLTQLQEVLVTATPVLTENDVEQTLRSLNKLILAIGNWTGDDKDVKVTNINGRLIPEREVTDITV